MSHAQLIPVTDLSQAVLFTPAAAPAPIASERSLAEKAAIAVAAIKAQIIKGVHPLVAFSAGKDSSLVLNLAFTAIRELMAEGVAVPTLQILHSDTLLENPALHAYNKRQIKAIEAYSIASGIDAKVWVATPGLSSDWWVSILSGRTITSVGKSSKCSHSMKIEPLHRLKREVRKWIAEKEGVKPKTIQMATMIGTRFDESANRQRNMEKRGESATEAVETMAGTGEMVMSPIADFSTFDVFEYIGLVRSGKVECYDNFDELVHMYRELNGGDCMVVAFIGGKSQSQGCSGRGGCWSCTRVSTDASAEAMIASEDGKYLWMKPLNDLRGYLLARHFDPSARSWLGRTLNEETGEISISPNAYSPQFCLELLRLSLTIQRDEERAARKLGIAPRFTILTLRQIIAIDMGFGRYGYQPPFTALRTYQEVYEQGKSYRIPDVATLPKFTEKDVAFRSTIKFADENYHDIFNGLRNIEWALADCEETMVTGAGRLLTNVVIGNEYDIDEEGSELFMEFELDRALDRISLDGSPASVVHYFLGLGTVQLFKGSQGEWDRMLKLSNQLYRHGLQTILNDPHAIIARLNSFMDGTFQGDPVAPASFDACQMPLF